MMSWIANDASSIFMARVGTNHEKEIIGGQRPPMAKGK